MRHDICMYNSNTLYRSCIGPQFGVTPLMVAAARGHAASVRHLCTTGASIHRKDNVSAYY